MNSVFKALSDPTRRKVLELLRERPMTAGELSAQFPVSRPTMSAHFNVLKEADLVDAERRGIPYVWFTDESGAHQVKDIRSGEQVAADPATWMPPAEDLSPQIVVA